MHNCVCLAFGLAYVIISYFSTVILQVMFKMLEFIYIKFENMFKQEISCWQECFRDFLECSLIIPLCHHFHIFVMCSPSACVSSRTYYTLIYERPIHIVKGYDFYADDFIIQSPHIHIPQPFQGADTNFYIHSFHIILQFNF